MNSKRHAGQGQRLRPRRLTKAAPELDGLLRQDASGDNWSRVVHRCAWCRRSFDEYGACANVVSIDRTAVVTDGMCSACGSNALASLAQRRARPLAA